ncbi:DoxX family protein [Spirosoma sp.]|uniref:DoxX family protein n=1 Tax=Spirosoma sp. TaxID=1899569 RepID=UPI002616A3DD|nr:DoxX family protein [Spirosoma sp.]MCX6216931.1 DoxX family protein [Spirosoma sp.]
MNTLAIRKSTKKDRIIYWTATLLIVLFDSVGALGFNTPLAIEGTRHLGFPDYFRVELSLGKILGGILLVLPMIPARIKEWAYVGFGISMISAIIANLVVDGPAQASLPFVCLMVLIVSYVYYHRTRK